MRLVSSLGSILETGDEDVIDIYFRLVNVHHFYDIVDDRRWWRNSSYETNFQQQKEEENTAQHFLPETLMFNSTS